MAKELMEFLQDNMTVDTGEIFVITSKDTPKSIISFLLAEKDHWKLNESLKTTKAELIDIIHNIPD